MRDAGCGMRGAGWGVLPPPSPHRAGGGVGGGGCQGSLLRLPPVAAGTGSASFPGAPREPPPGPATRPARPCAEHLGPPRLLPRSATIPRGRPGLRPLAAPQFPTVTRWQEMLAGPGTLGSASDALGCKPCFPGPMKPAFPVRGPCFGFWGGMARAQPAPQFRVALWVLGLSLCPSVTHRPRRGAGLASARRKGLRGRGCPCSRVAPPGTCNDSAFCWWRKAPR